MTTFIHVDQTLTHAGVERVEAAINQLSSAGKHFKGARGLAALLLGAAVSALVVAAFRLVVNLADGGLLLGWVVLWSLTFVALALLADTAHSLSLGVKAAWRRATERRELT
ncbi:hypothetical protein QTI66_29130 [Variovorax sp. J22R133]|uniref:hypothetical protein n=1 Tax=Variovorax brevis TaxID=3053503 RepID=UPI002578C58C|nr:hypothetical protein [Variovorax sp. J22R133]MDM0116234.1 hypothetical protein [Variovorax sp. J22R133]